MSKQPKNFKYIKGILFKTIIINGFFFFFLAFIFDGGAFPWGMVIDNQHYIITGTSKVAVSQLWFWFTYWHGSVTWIGIGILAIVLSLYGVYTHVKHKDWIEAIKLCGVLIAMFFWTYFMTKTAVIIIT